MRTQLWLTYALITTIFWGVWGALIEIPEKAGFPATLGYSVWAISMILPAIFALRVIKWKLDVHQKAILHGIIIGLTGALGQLVLFQALKTGPAYLVFPFISLAPLVTILLSYWLIKERAAFRSWIGIILALLAIPLLSYQSPEQGQTYGQLWILLSLFVFLAWGVQAYFMKVANEHMKAESIFFYMMLTGIMLIPIALMMTDFSQDIYWGFEGPYLATGIQLLNAVGALCLVYAFRHGKAIVVSPLTNAGAPVITIILSLVIYGFFPHWVILSGMILAVIAILLMAES
ncbi:DMT family transporter [Catalinimonas alkaloidigena]|uniref:DMT family transporter n=1 Tax=Catalinimonas alkaloidigena TaxID=1075417 RepID=UPI0024075B99|nr:DMT family transporter [Catalinimonas alkaloidigena]